MSVKVPGVQNVPIDEIAPYENNPKMHPEAQIKLIERLIKRFGFLVPMVLDKNNQIVAGHGRYEAAKRLGLKEVPALRADHLSETEIRAFRIADNKATESRWKLDILQTELQGLKDLDFDLTLTGFSADILGKEGSTEPALPENLRYSVIVDFGSEDEQRNMLLKLEAEGYQCRLLIA